MNSRYGCANLLLDVFLTLCTGGLWILWILVRQARKS